ncbi:MAG: O-antigen ligase family protein [Parvibaculum sp.]|uniref:O-antigen ligase family protein n=1 Tax=Parvibaculum sp. TaxID=2024848 RepID=UPI0025FA827F|nr:O-antigen ligase family protein [Parvibaculum sp.]MCE9648807.1 O-antigen ligase family protein [Parvibaculum sp.]
MTKVEWRSNILDALTVFKRPESISFAVLVSLSTWISVLAPRVMGIVMPVAAVFALIGAIRLRQRMRMPLMENEVWLFWAGTVLLVTLSAFWSPDVGYGLERSVKIATSLALAIFLFFLAVELSEEHRSRLRKLLVVSFIFGLFLITVNMLTDAGLYRLVTSGKALDKAEVGANRAAVVMAVLLWPTLLAAFEAGWVRIGWLLPALTLGAILLTHSQTAPVVVLLGFVVYAFCRFAPRLGTVLVGIIGVALILLMPFFFLETCSSILQPGIGWQAASAGARIEIWCAVSSAIPDAFFFGHGVEGARAVQHWGMAHLYFPGGGILHPHNAALQIWYEYGVVGALFASALWGVTVRRLSGLTPHARAICFAALTSIAVVSYISHGLWQSWWLGTVGIIPALFRMVAGNIWFGVQGRRGPL